jgi:hypothetical protein
MRLVIWDVPLALPLPLQSAPGNAGSVIQGI